MSSICQNDFSNTISRISSNFLNFGYISQPRDMQAPVEVIHGIFDIDVNRNTLQTKRDHTNNKN